MNEHDDDRAHPGGDGDIARKFAQMRRAEAAAAPPFPDQALPHSGTGPARPGLLTPPRIAAAVALVAITAALLSSGPGEDPATLYASIMAGQQMQTDPLLVVSQGVLPAMSEVPSLYEIDIEFDPDSYAN